jgi:hypothetical protein
MGVKSDRASAWAGIVLPPARTLCLLLGLGWRGFCPVAVAAEDLLFLPEDLPHNYGVIGVQVSTAGTDTLGVRKLTHLGPAQRAGLQVGDRLIGARPYRLRTADELSRYIKSLTPDTPVTLLLERGGAPLEISVEVTDRRRLYFLMGEQGATPGISPGGRHRGWSQHTGALEKAALELIQRQDATSDLQDLLKAFALEADRYAGDCRLEDVHYALLNPLKGGQIAAGMARQVRETRDLRGYLAIASEHLDLEEGGGRGDDGDSRHPRLEELLNQAGGGPLGDLLSTFFGSGLKAQSAFAALTAEERDELFANIPALLERFGKTRSLDEGDSLETETHINTLRLAKRVDLSTLFDAARDLARLTTPATLKRIRRSCLELRDSVPPKSLPKSFRGEFLLAQNTDWGWILVGGKGPNFYGADAALIVDLGGDDTYVNNCAAPTFVSAYRTYDTGGQGQRGGSRRQIAPVGMIIDYGGDDRYIGNRLGSVGAAVGGVGMLLDLAGNDLYQGSELTQGAAFCGIGVVWDRRGSDSYLAQASAQGAAFFGAGLLLDDSGDELYSSTLYSQAFGGTRGFGMLYDGVGDDRYVADRKVPSGYGTEGIYSGWSQGVGCGFRRYSSGGVGLLVDGEGDDDYQAGNFSQGLGYFFGLGGLVDLGGDDVYRGTRYTQGASAHQAVGVLLDRNGDDEYHGQIAANQGGAWDVGVGILEDGGGDDRYYTPGVIAQGSAAMNGLGLLFDRGGRDSYQAGSASQGNGGSTEYWGGREALNLGILIDVGGEEDSYSLGNRRDNAEVRAGTVGLFLDR